MSFSQLVNVTNSSKFLIGNRILNFFKQLKHKREINHYAEIFNTLPFFALTTSNLPGILSFSSAT